MSKPKCPKCEKNEFGYEFMQGETNDCIYILFCKDCGHVVGCTATPG